MSNSRLEILIVALFGLSAPLVQAEQPWVLGAVKIYPAPDTSPISGKIVIASSRIQSVVPASDTRAMAATKAPGCQGGVVVAGFQNSHVHFIGDEFFDARHQAAETLNVALTQMLTRYGYTTVFDIASDRDNTMALRDRVEKGRCEGTENPDRGPTALSAARLAGLSRALSPGAAR